MRSIAKDKILSFLHFLEEAGSIAITSHVHPDGDAVGSSSALLSFLTDGLHADARIILPEPPADNLAFIIPDHLRGKVFYGPQAAKAAEGECDLIVCLDCNGFTRTEALGAYFEASSAKKILIDHHVSPDSGSFDLVFSETEISSASELLYHILKGTGRSLPLPCATALMAGMTTDTNNFANSVYPTTLEMASDLLSQGVDRDRILDCLYNRCRENRIRLMGHALQDLLTITDQGAACIILRRSDKDRYDVQEGETEGFVNIPLTIGKVRLSIFLKEEDGLFRVSIRSARGVSARSLAATWFHGGGHEQAAGGKVLIPDDIPSPDGIDAYILDILQQFMK